MKQLFRFLFLMSAILPFTSCDKEDEPIADITGNWSGESRYYNPASGTKSQYLSIDFFKDGTGELSYEAPTSSSIAYFTYNISGSMIHCSGSWGSLSDGSIDTNFQLNIRIDEDRLIPLDRFKNFILTRDGSIITTLEGEEIIDHSKTLENAVWISDDNSSVLTFDGDHTYTKYILSSRKGSYVHTFSGSYYYDAVRNIINFDGEVHDISFTLIQDGFSYRKKDGDKWYYYHKGTSSDIPWKIDIPGRLLYHRFWHARDRHLTFYDGIVVYFETGDKVGSYGTVTLLAKGTFEITDYSLTCRFTEVDWEYSSSYPNMFPDWEAGKAVTKQYRIEMNDEYLIMEDSKGKKYYYEPD